MCLVERLFSSALVTLVSVKQPRMLRVMHFQKGTEICTHAFGNSILAVKMNRLVRERNLTPFTCTIIAESCRVSGECALCAQHQGYEESAYDQRHAAE